MVHAYNQLYSYVCTVTLNSPVKVIKYHSTFGHSS